MTNTIDAYDQILSECRHIFQKKLEDYGPAWRIMRQSSITDQIYIKLLRIRNIQKVGVQKIPDSLYEEYIGVINYSIIAIIQSEKKESEEIDITVIQAIELFDKIVKEIRELLQKKNHDYGEAWKSLRVTTLVDLILQKIFRIKQLEDNDGKAVISEGTVANYQDMVNYAVFSIILDKLSSID